ncbi:rhodanese-like domain-containing protein [Microterricola pindariensis]|uniref:Sulfurtransferase n=1 Tax=Microterricola pindariensis TaxID=478010 RepID=A0ABX5AV91_9MICO|nr:rhodanese-like domain-containing protein [Microterricola pindariensis]PPL18822.1 sulfurtransferase [Microterricola pindariensis]
MTASQLTASPASPVAPIFGAEPAASRDEAVAHFRAKLAFETDASDVWAELEAGDQSFVLVDTRSDAAWAQGRAAGAVHLPTARIAGGAAALLPAGTNVVVYCWSPGCNGSTKAALALSLQGYAVREMIGGFEYWAREGYPVETDAGTAAGPMDPLVGPVSSGTGAAGIRCDC